MLKNLAVIMVLTACTATTSWASSTTTVTKDPLLFAISVDGKVEQGSRQEMLQTQMKEKGIAAGVEDALHTPQDDLLSQAVNPTILQWITEPTMLTPENIKAHNKSLEHIDVVKFRKMVEAGLNHPSLIVQFLWQFNLKVATAEIVTRAGLLANVDLRLLFRDPATYDRIEEVSKKVSKERETDPCLFVYTEILGSLILPILAEEGLQQSMRRSVTHEEAITEIIRLAQTEQYDDRELAILLYAISVLSPADKFLAADIVSEMGITKADLEGSLSSVVVNLERKIATGKVTIRSVMDDVD
jgi:hypothetical protein